VRFVDLGQMCCCYCQGSGMARHPSLRPLAIFTVQSREGQKQRQSTHSHEASLWASTTKCLRLVQ
jgi:hypothetical protein